ncbi:molybdenum cofactor biosynthesis protein MoaE [Novosphingobium sp. M1R2S20]|uniref:Molybdopterin synthase catalytic subunit n=1 Tax=Novosphingobium rhizovicinum TaxID=3228928 RepID=A0ABV3REV5_9SPHN
MNWRFSRLSAGGEMPRNAADVRLFTCSFSPEAELARFTQAHPRAGGVVSFLGQVRSSSGVEAAGDAVEALELRHYEPLTLPAMHELAERILGRWDLEGLLVIHRSGTMMPGDPIVLVAAAARHRRSAFAAADFAMDHLKSESWFWKREKVGGQWRWVEPRAEDYQDIARWS